MTTPYALVSRVQSVLPADKAELIRRTRLLERAALLAPPRAVAAALQDQRYLTDRTRQIYARLAAAGVDARLHARGLQSWLAPGVVGVSLDDDDPLVDEWVVVIAGPDPVVLAATDLRAPHQADAERRFAYAVSQDAGLVRDCATLLGVVD